MGNMRRNPRTEFGCNLSHLMAISHAIRDGVETALFLEDDVRFVGDPTEALGELPDSWSLVFLGGHPRGPCSRYTKSLVRISSFSFAESYGMTWESMREFQDFWFSRIGQRDAMFDFCLSDFGKTKESYACYPLVTQQVAGVSQISGKQDEKGPLVTKGWQTNLA
jgi:GR25 family glycosyltransferase involved in LPS biosynthesis